MAAVGNFKGRLNDVLHMQCPSLSFALVWERNPTSISGNMTYSFVLCIACHGKIQTLFCLILLCNGNWNCRKKAKYQASQYLLQTYCPSTVHTAIPINTLVNNLNWQDAVQKIIMGADMGVNGN
jgi:hypothetical protein